MVVKVLIEGEVKNIKTTEKGKQYICIYTTDDEVVRVFTDEKFDLNQMVSLQCRLVFDKGFMSYNG